MTSERRADGKVIICFHIKPEHKQRMKRIAEEMDRETLSDVIESLALYGLAYFLPVTTGDEEIMKLVLMKREGVLI